MGPDRALAASIARGFRRHLLEEYVPRIRRCSELLTADQLWQKPSAHGNSIANLLLHLEGNVRQWILVGLGGEDDARDRDAEFAATTDQVDAGADELLARLEGTVRAACELVESLSPERLLTEYEFQRGRFRGDGVSCVLHVLEHFSGHAGQIYAWTKQLTDADLKFYDL